MSKSRITIIRERFSKWDGGNGNPELEDCLYKYIRSMEVLSVITRDDFARARATNLKNEAETMLSWIQQTYMRNTEGCGRKEA